MAVVTFDWLTFATRYPELAQVGQALAQLYFNEAQLYCDNTDTSPVADVATRAVLLNMLTAHIAALNASLNGAPSSPLVGRISSATEGSVNVSAELNLLPGSSQWFAQTKYGIAFWQSTMRYRMFLYRPGVRRIQDPVTLMFPQQG